MNNDFWFYFLAAAVILVTSIQAAITYKRRRLIPNLITLCANIVILIGIILVYFYRQDFLGGIGSIGVRILLIIVIWIVILFSLFSGEIMKFIHKLKKK
jgi:hypothetical protein